MTTLDEKTKVNLWAVLASIPIMAAFVFWFSALAFHDDVLAVRLEKVESKQKEIDSIMYDVHERVIRIEEKINHKGCEK